MGGIRCLTLVLLLLSVEGIDMLELGHKALWGNVDRCSQRVDCGIACGGSCGFQTAAIASTDR